jgi:GDP-4-dehydro-6-deoxy-D-mannose reductase
MPVWLVTGGSGFLGQHLLAELKANRPLGVSIVAAGRRCPKGWDRAAFVALDLEDSGESLQVINDLRPSCIFHLAGKTPPATDVQFNQLNAVLTARLMQELAIGGFPCRFILAGSAAELGPVPVEDLPVAEDYPCQPTEPYGASKCRSTRIALSSSRPPLEVLVARVFNPIGPGLPVSQSLGRFASILSEGTGPIRLRVGDLDARRDFIDVRDVAAGLLGLALRGQPGELYHVGTGHSHAVREGLDALIRLSGRDVTVDIDPALARQRGPSDSRAQIRKIQDHVGWSPGIAWDRSLIDLWNAAIERSDAGLTDSGPLV